VSRLAFLGTPEAAVTVLLALHEAGHEVAVVVTAPDRRRGRGSSLTPTPVKSAAFDLGLRVTDQLGDVVDAGVDLGVVVAFGKILRADVLDRVLMVNVHFSLLPRWRGAAPVERAILAGDERTGVCLMKIDEGLDTGPVYECRSLAVEPHEIALELRSRLAVLGADLAVERLRGGLATLGEPVPQAGEPTYAAKIDPADLRIDWRRPAVEIERLVRVGRAWTRFRGRRLIVERCEVVEEGPAAGSAGGRSPGTVTAGVVATGEGSVRLLEVRPEGRRVQGVDTWARGARLAPTERLGDGDPH
jgi:methionyl-tRNA formyltransferase